MIEWPDVSSCMSRIRSSPRSTIVPRGSCFPRSFRELGYESTLVCGRFAGEPPPGIHIVETSLVVKDTRAGGRLRSLMEPLLAFREIVRQRPDLVIIGPIRSSLFTALPLVGLYRWFEARGRSSRTKFILKADWSLDETGLSASEAVLSRGLLVASTHLLDLVSIETTCGVRRAQELPGIRPEKVVRVPLAFPQGTLERIPYEHGPREPVILCVARIARMKGQDVLVRAFAQLAGRFPAWSLRLVGPVDDPAYQEELVALAVDQGITERVVFSGFLQQAMVDREFSRASVFCLPSVHSESGGQVKYEATAFGLPIVTTDVPCGPDAIEMGCLVARSRDASDLATQLGRLMGDERERERVSNGAQSKLGSYLDLVRTYLSATSA